METADKYIIAMFVSFAIAMIFTFIFNTFVFAFTFAMLGVVLWFISIVKEEF